MKKALIVISACIGITGLNMAFAAGEIMRLENHPHAMHSAMHTMDTRISLGISAEMKQHQLSNMREHLAAINSIVGLISENKFDEASKMARTRLGLNPEMQKMCSSFGNEKFMALGMAFHKSGDDLGDALKTQDVNTSLRALNKTMQYCVECHAVYRQ